MGKGTPKRAQYIFTFSILLIAVFTLIIGVMAFAFQEQLIYFLGANEETYPYAKDYLKIMLLFGFVFTIENALSIFVRNDQNPNLAMFGLIVTSFTNIGINYYFLYVLNIIFSVFVLLFIISLFILLLIFFANFFFIYKNLLLL